MLRISFFLFACLFMNISARSQAMEGKLEYQKTLQPVAYVELPCTQEVAEHAIKDYMEKRGVRGTGFKQFTVYRSVKLDSNDAELSDLYFSVNRKNRQQKDICVISLLPSGKNQEILSRQPADSARTGKAVLFLNNMAPFIESFNTEVQADNQDAIVKKAQKKMNELKSDENDLNKKIRSLQSDLEQNKKDQAIQSQRVQDNLVGNDEAKKKAHKKMDHLLDDQGDLERKIRKAQLSLEQNKKDQEDQQQEIDKQKQVLDAIKGRQKT